MKIEVRNIHKYYGPLHILKGIDLTIHSGEIVSIVGASGAGKTTLLHIMGSLEPPSDGQVLYDGIDIFKLSPKELAFFRNKHIGFVFQFHFLIPELSAVENVMLPALFAPNHQTKQIREKAFYLLERLGLKDRFYHKPSALSGGEQQRVAVARALINSPDVILADEPSGNLDSANALALHALFMNLKEEFNQTFVIITHNPELATYSDRQIHLKDGIIQ
ncbi:MAG: ABC transporter ATP-binding protein [Bacteroidales bacterium]|nr:ABC transporter ATP-binding protein [Bacteroidales bacterium]